jgi:sugar phosphate permease
MIYPPLRLAIAVWGLAAAFYLFGFFQRVTPGVLTAELMRDFQLSAAGLGNLSAFYFYAYCAMQIPTGLMVDRFGPRVLLLTGAVLGGLGAIGFALADSALLASTGRALIGAAHGLAWVSMLTLAAHWFDARRFGTISGWSLAIGTLGAVLAGTPLRLLSEQVGWRGVMFGSGLFALAIGCAMFFVLRNDPSERGYLSYRPEEKRGDAVPMLAGLVQIWRYRNTFWLVLVPSGICGAVLSFAGLWGVPFFVQHHGLATRDAAWITSGMLVAFSVGGIAWGSTSDRWNTRKLPFVLGGMLMVIAMGALVLAPASPLPVLVPLLIAGAFGAGSMVLMFAWAKESVPPALAGTVTGVMNAGVMVGPLVQQPLMGAVLDRYTPLINAAGVKVYPLAGYKAAFAVLYLWVLLSFLCLLMVRDTHARQRA